VGINDFRMHDMRHTCAAWLVSSGVSLIEVRHLLGHSTIKMTERYAHLAPENLRKAVRTLENRSHSGHPVVSTVAGCKADGQGSHNSQMKLKGCIQDKWVGGRPTTWANNPVYTTLQTPSVTVLAASCADALYAFKDLAARLG